MQDWDDIRYFLALARTGSTTAAAKLLAVNHSTISRRIGQLEARMGVRLFDRLASGVVPTAAGSALIEVAEQVERDVTQFSRGANANDARLAGRLTVTAPALLAHHVLMPMIADFSARHPQIELEVVASDQVASLSKHEADVAIRATAAPQDTLLGYRLLASENALFCSAAYLRTKALTPEQVRTRQDLDWIWLDQGRGKPDWALAGFAEGRVGAKVDSKLTALAAALSGLGIVELPVVVAGQMPQLARLPGFTIHSDRDIWVLYHRDFRRTARVRAFVTDIRQQFSALKMELPGDGAQQATTLTANPARLVSL